jgi:hypothetical protein
MTCKELGTVTDTETVLYSALGQRTYFGRGCQVQGSSNKTTYSCPVVTDTNQTFMTKMLTNLRGLFRRGQDNASSPRWMLGRNGRADRVEPRAPEV